MVVLIIVAVVVIVMAIVTVSFLNVFAVSVVDSVTVLV